MAATNPLFASLISFVRLLRLNRSPMVAMITGTAAFVAGAGVGRSLWMTLAGFCLAVGGFSMDLYADRDLDVSGPRANSRHNPLAAGAVPLPVGLAFSLTFVIVSVALILWIAPRALLPWAVILAIIVGLALHHFETALARAFTLGMLQALYVWLGGMAGRPSPGLAVIAAVFFFAMFGGRGLTDIRDYPQDITTSVQTLPKRLGVQGSALFTAVCLCIAYALSVAAYLTGEFSANYLFLDAAFVLLGVVLAVVFAARPSPRLAHVLTPVFMAGMGGLLCLALILGKA